MKEKEKELKKAVQEIAKENGVSNKKIADETGLHAPHISRFYSCTTGTTIEYFLKVAKAAGVEWITLTYNKNSTITIEL